MTDYLRSFLAYFRPAGQLDGNTEIIALFSEQRDGETTDYYSVKVTRKQKYGNLKGVPKEGNRWQYDVYANNYQYPKQASAA